ncbi:MAG: recombinase family protein [Afipia sp.]|nr:recombinase family protein [Afipia sp.]
MRAVIYSRVSTQKQNTENQLIELREVARRNGFTIVAELSDDGISGSKGRKDRPAFDMLHKMISRREVDLLMTWSIDRLGRSLSDLVALMSELEVKKVDFYSHIQAIDSRTPAGKLSFAIFGAIAEFEREIIRDRVNAGLARARSEGKILGRPTNVNSNTKIAVQLMRDKGASIHRIARELKIGVGTTQKLLKEAA